MTELVWGFSPHLMMLPILLPMLTAALMLLLGEKRRPWKALVNVASTLIGLGVAIALLRQADAAPGAGATFVYLAGNWQAPYGITLAVDRLSALMLVLAGIVSVASVLFAVARWDRAGVHFHPLFQIQLMGLNGAFLTADLFNLFVFFEVLLAASYGLLLHGSGRERVLAGLHYIAINLVASSLFLVGAALVYGVTGTLNLADLATRIAAIPPADRGLLHAGAAVLGIAFLTKAAMWPLGFWLVPAYSAAIAPVSALFAIMTKVGIYVVLRLWMLLFPSTAGVSAHFGGEWIVYGGLATLAFGAVGMLASHTVPRLASYSLVVSSGLLLASLGFGDSAVTGGTLYYLLSSTLGVSALFMLAELITRARLPAGVTVVQEEKHLAFPVESFEPMVVTATEVDGDPALIGKAIPAAWAFLGLSFIACTLLITGMPPLSGFVGKFAVLSTLLASSIPDVSNTAGAVTTMGPARWVFFGLVIVSGLASLLGLLRVGIRYFWGPQEGPPPRLRVIECGPIAALLLVCIVLTVAAAPVMRYTQAAAAALNQPSQYIDAVLSAKPRPGPVTNPNAGTTP
ncbi:monovalent cation/H+ antiporter subunit D [soil metagenome]